MSEEQVGVVAKFFVKPSVAAVKIVQGSIKKGDRLRFKGHTTDFEDVAMSMEIDNQAVEEAQPGDFIGLKIKERVRENDKVYKVSE